MLRGRDAVEYGDVTATAVSPRVAVALTRGRFPKPYAYVDPNEDAVAAVVGRRATLLVVADGHNGKESSEVVIDFVLRRLGDDPPPADLPDDALVDLFVDAGAAVRRATSRLPYPNRESRTTLTVALLAGRRLQWAGMGDSALLVASAGGGHELTSPRHDFVGFPIPPAAVDARLRRGADTLPDDAWVVLASDGFTNFVAAPTPAAAVVTVLRRTDDPLTAACGLLHHAAAGGAGDNVAVAVASPG